MKNALLFAGLFILSCTLAGALSGCGHGQTAADDEGDPADKMDVRTPVTVTTVSHDPLNDYIELNAVSAFLQRAFVKATTNGYLQSNDVYPGKYVDVGQLLFTLKTKEAQTLGNSLKILDSTLKFSGLIRITAGQRGYITQLNHQAGDYVQDGEQLAVISDRNSFVFLLNLPYELRPQVLGRKTVTLILPDGNQLEGTVGPVMPSVDSVSQTQNVVIRVSNSSMGGSSKGGSSTGGSSTGGSPAGGSTIPENLIAKVRIAKSVPGSGNAQSLPKAALLTDETENEFWVMKMISDSVAVKVPVKRGVETSDRVQITSPVFSPGDRILITGNYGLSDTAKVVVEKTPAE